MLNKRRFFTLIFFALMLTALSVSNAWAITSITSTLKPTLNSDEGEPILRIKKGDTFTFSLTALYPIGTINWNLTYYDNPYFTVNTAGPDESPYTQIDDGGITLSAKTGNTITVNGTLRNEHGYYAVIEATDSSAVNESNNAEVYAYYYFWIENVDDYPSNSDENGSVPAPTNPEEEAVNTQPQKIEELHVGIIEAVQLDDDVMQKLADNAGIDKSELHLLTNEDFTTTTPPEPTQSMRDQVASDGYQFAAKLNTINVKEDGYYVFKVTVSDDLVGVNVSDLKLYYAEDSDFTTSAINSVKLAFGLMPIINGVTGGLEVSNFLGVKLDTVPKQFLATMFLSASKSITVYIVRILLLLLGGCNVGIGIAGALIVGFVTVKFFKKRK